MTHSKIFTTPLDLQEIYPCPLCGVGKISQMPMMETMACDFCSEIFIVNQEEQQINVTRKSPPSAYSQGGDE